MWPNGKQSEMQDTNDGLVFMADIPPSQPLLGRVKTTPYVITGDDAFALTKYLIKPYSQSSLTEERRIFIYRLSRTWRISENAFEILANRWRIFRSQILLNPEKVIKIRAMKQNVSGKSIQPTSIMKGQSRGRGASVDLINIMIRL